MMGVLSMRSDLLPPLPQSVAEIAEVIGRDNALSFIARLPASGSRSWRKCVYVPKRMPPDHNLVKLLGWSDAQKMRAVFGGEILQPSNCRFVYRRHRNRQLLRMASENVPLADIADMLELSVYRVREIIALEPKT